MVYLKVMRVLLVEDDVDLRELTETSLTLEGFKVTPTRDGWEALEVLKAGGEPFDSIALDLMMPVMTGYEFLEAVKDFLNLPRIVICSSMEPSRVPKGYPHYRKTHGDLSELIKLLRA